MTAPQGKAAARAAEEAVRPQPQRFRVNVPAADEAVLAWMAAQYNHSLSMRILIRESIERHGYIDVMNRPVDQLPKRGRPTATEDVQSEAEMSAQAQLSAPPALHPLPPAAGHAQPGASTDLDLTDGQDTRTELLGIALESPALVPVSAPERPQAVAPAPSVPAPTSPEPSSSGQVDVNDIFASTR